MKLSLSEKQLQRQIQYFAYYQLAGAIITVSSAALMLAKVETVSDLLLLLFSGVFGLTGFAGYCGYRCLKQPAQGLRLSRLSLLTQFVGVAAGGFSFHFFVGPSLAISLDLTTELLVKVSASLSDFSIKLSSDTTTLILSVNLVAMLLFFRTTVWLNEWQYRYNADEVSAASQQP